MQNRIGEMDYWNAEAMPSRCIQQAELRCVAEIIEQLNARLTTIAEQLATGAEVEPGKLRVDHNRLLSALAQAPPVR